MNSYIALIRAINVGGKNIIKMAELKRMFEATGLSQVQTYIQSGNIVFTSEEEAEQLQPRIEFEINSVFGIPAAVMLRTSIEWKSIIENCPYEADSLSEGESIYVSFLAAAPSQEAMDKLTNVQSANDEFRINGREIYLWLRQSMRDSKLASTLPKLKVQSTTRNWQTVNKLAVMVNALKV
jgi:uncharacterized protein (DUF1697 family)